MSTLPCLHPPDVSDFRIVGSTAYQHVPKAPRNKLAAKSEKVIFVGYSGRGKSNRLWHPGTKKISGSSDVRNFEDDIDIPHNPPTSALSRTEGGYDNVNIPSHIIPPVPVVSVQPILVSATASISAPITPEHEFVADHPN